MSAAIHEVTLESTDDEVWVEVGGLLVRVLHTDEGACCDIYDVGIIGVDQDAAHLGACYTFFNEIGGQLSDSPASRRLVTNTTEE